MGIQLPGWLRYVGDLVGEPFPEGDETACRRQSDRWRHFADQLEQHKAEIEAATRTTLSGFICGDVHNTLQTELPKLTSADQGSIDTLIPQLRALAEATDDVATEIETAKLAFITNLGLLAATIAALVASAWFNWGAPVEIAGAVAAARAVLTRIVGAAVMKLVEGAAARVITELIVKALEGAVINAVISGGINAGIQTTQIVQGHRGGFDWGSFGREVGTGAISGAVAGPIMHGASRFDTGSSLGNHVRNFGAGFAANTGGALAAQAPSGQFNLGDAFGAGLVYGGIDGVRPHHATEASAPGGTRSPGSETSPAPANRTGADVDRPLNLGSRDSAQPATAAPSSDARTTATPSGSDTSTHAPTPNGQPASTGHSTTADATTGTGARTDTGPGSHIGDSATQPSNSSPTTAQPAPAAHPAASSSVPAGASPGAGPTSSAPTATGGSAAPSHGHAGLSEASSTAPAGKPADAAAGSSTTQPAGTPVARTAADTVGTHPSAIRDAAEAPRASAGSDTATRPSSDTAHPAAREVRTETTRTAVPDRTLTADTGRPAGPDRPAGTEPPRPPAHDRPAGTEPSRPAAHDRPASSEPARPATDTSRPAAQDRPATLDPARPAAHDGQRSDSTRSADSRPPADTRPAGQPEPRPEETAVQPSSAAGHPLSKQEGGGTPESERHPESGSPSDSAMPPVAIAPVLPGVEGGGIHTRAGAPGARLGAPDTPRAPEHSGPAADTAHGGPSARPSGGGDGGRDGAGPSGGDTTHGPGPGPDDVARAIAELDAHRTEGDVGDTARVHQQANAVAEKWNALDPATRQAVIDHETQAGHRSILGDLDGLPAQVRDRFNRHNLVEDMVHKHPGQEHAGAIRQWATEWEAHRRDPENVSQPDSNHKDFEKLPDTEPPKSRLDKVAKLFEFRSSETRSVERTWHETYRVAEGGRPRQLYLYDPQAFNGDGRIAVGIGDLDTAEAIAVNTPGITSTIRSIETNINNAENLQIRATQQTPEVRTASLAWIGYDAPSGLGLRHTARATFAEAGGHRLAHDVAGLHAARGGEDPAIHLFGHSYGSTTTAFAGEGGRLGSYVETVTLLGSPGAGPLAHAGDFGVGEHNVFVAANTADIVTLLGGAEGRFHQILGHFGLGLDPASSPFGATRITAQYLAPELTRGLIDPHTHYYASEGIDARGNPILLRDNAHVRVTESLDNFSHILTGHTERLNLEVAPHEPQHRFSDPTWMRRAEPATGYPGPNECARHTIEGFTERHGNEIEQPKDHGAQGVLRPDYEQALKTHFRDGCLDDIIAAARDGHSVIVVDTYHRADLPDGHPGSHTYSVEPNPADPNRPLVYDGDASGPRPWPPQGLDRVSRTEIATFHPDGTPTHPAEEPHALQGANDRIAGERTGARLDDGDALWQEGNRAPDHNGSHASQPAEQEMHPPGWDHIQSAEPMGPGWERASDEPIDPNETPHGDPRPDWDPGHAPFDPNRVDPETGKLWSDPTAPYGRDPDGNAYTEREYAERFHRLGPNGEHYVSYPPNGGAVRGTILDYHDAHQFVRDFTDKIDRIGKPEGKYLALMEGGQPAPFEARSLHYETLYQSHNSYTLNPDNVPPGWRIRISEAAPAQGRPGGCLQLVVVDAKGKEVPVRELKDDYGILR